MTVLLAHPAGPDTVRYADADAHRLELLADRLKAVADPTRLRLLAALQARPEQRACVSELTAATGLAQPTVSRHLQLLHRSALLRRTRQGSRTYYQLNDHALRALALDLTTPHPL